MILLMCDAVVHKKWSTWKPKEAFVDNVRRISMMNDESIQAVKESNDNKIFMKELLVLSRINSVSEENKMNNVCNTQWHLVCCISKFHTIVCTFKIK